MSDKVNRVQLLNDAKAQLTPWTTEDGRLFLDYTDLGVRRTMAITPVGNCDFRGWFSAFCVDQISLVPNGDLVNSAQTYFAHWTRTRGPKLKDYIRVGGRIGELYLDTGNDANDAWRITPTGIELVKGGPTHIRMLRGAGVLPLIEPDFDADPSEFPALLRKYIASDDDTLMLLTAWLLGCLRPEGPTRSLPSQASKVQVSPPSCA